MTIITSKSNNLIKKTKKLLQKKHRKNSYLIEGWHLFEEAQKSGATFLNIFVIESLADHFTDSSQIVLVSPEVLKELADSPTPQGIVAEVEMKNKNVIDLTQGRYLILEDVQDPGNVGTMIRTADAAGLDGVIISNKTADIYNQKTLRSMQGSHFHLPIWRMDILSACEKLQELSVPVIATTLSQDSIDYRQIKEQKYFALVMGNEGQGISEEMVEKADILAHIVMPGQAESLNVAVAAGIVIFRLI
jgi:TrmH family RNA methyltransferase